MSELPQPDFARDMRIVGYSDQGGLAGRRGEWCIAASPMSATCFPKALASSTCAIQKSETGRYLPAPAGGLYILECGG